MSEREHRVSVDGGKYTFVIPAGDHRVSILRHGKPWHGPQAEACSALHSMMCELDAARVVLAAARAVVANGGEMPDAIVAALEVHDWLVGNEPALPSEWTR